MELLHTAADGALPNGHKNTVGLGELRVVQAIKQVIHVNLKPAARWARLSLPSLSTQKRGQRAAHDRTHGQPTASRIRPKKTCRSRRKFERDRHRNLGDFDRPAQMGRLLEVPIGLASGQVELA
jgi:hypothetical protein